MDIKTQKYEADLTAASKDLQDVKTKIAINYHIDGDSAPVIYREIGLNYAEKVIYPLEQEINKAATAQFTAEELITKRDAVREIMKNTLMEKLRTRGIIVEEISIINFEFSKSFSESIEAKVVMEQSALTAKNKLEQVKYEAEQKIAAAQGEAKAIQIRGEALKNNPGVIELNWIEKWDGHQPMVVGGATPLINLPANL